MRRHFVSWSIGLPLTLMPQFSSVGFKRRIEDSVGHTLSSCKEHFNISIIYCIASISYMLKESLEANYLAEIFVV